MSNVSAVEALFFAALEQETAAERAAYLDSACGGDAELRRQVEKLLKAHPRVGDFLNKPVVEQLAAAPEPADATQEIDASTAGQGAGPAGRNAPFLARTEGEGSADNPVSDLDFLQPSTRPGSLGRLGHYEMLQVLGQGGFGIVFRAFDETLQRVVAIKVLAPQLAATSPARKRFLREARSSAKVRHENVVQVYAVEEQPLPYLVMEFVPGETLQERLDRVGPLETAEVLRISRQIAEGLAAAHATGLIHRDIKPGNILIEAGPHQHVKITDFGLARAADDASMTQSGLVAGTPMFMAPEQAQGDTLDHRADLFSLGSVLYTMCSGRPPFRANSTLAVLKRVAEDTPRPIPEIIPEVPQWLCDIIARLHAKKPEDRIGTAREVADLLERGLAAMQHPSKVKVPRVAAPAAVEKTPPREVPVAAPAIRRPRFRTYRWAAAAAVLLLLLGSLGLTEATGVTNFRGTVIRLFSPEGTLIVEVDDPGVSVKIDGSDIVITGAGTKEIRLKPGSYTVEASKDGKVVRHELVTVTKNGRQVVRVSQEAPPVALKKPSEDTPDPKPAKTDDEATVWERAVAGLSADQQVKFVAARLKDLNPGFDGKVEPTVEDGVVTGLVFSTEQVSDISPVRALTKLKNLNCSSGKLTDLLPLKGMKLATLVLAGTQVSDLSPLKGMPLTSLNFHTCPNIQDLTPLKGMKLTSLNIHDGPKVVDLEPLKGMPLTELWAGGNLVRDLSPLKGMPLTLLVLSHCPEVKDLSPLKGLSLNHLALDDTQVRDLEPLKDMLTLKSLYINAPGVTDVKPLQVLPLENLRLTPGNITQGLDILRNMKSLKTIGPHHYQAWPAAEFWARLDKGEFEAGKGASRDPNRRAAEYVLSIGGVVKVNEQDQEMKAAADLPRDAFRLTSVGLRDNKQVSDAGLANFKDCKDLTFLDLWGTEVTDAGLAHCKDCKDLKELSLAFTKVGDAGLAHFKGCKNLTNLELRFTEVGDAGLASFKDCKDLTELNLEATQVGDAGLAHFKDCKNLTNLNLSSEKVGDAGLAHFKGCKDLTFLILNSTQVSDAGLANFKDCKNLTNLYLNSTQLSDAGLAHLAGLDKLIDLGLAKTKVTAKGVEGLAKTLPQCKIAWDGGAIEPK